MSWWELRVWLWRMRRRVGVWGYFLEAVVWLRTVFLRRTPGTRLVIFAQGRTGSELLCDLLHSHSLIHCDKEILNQPVLSPYGHIRRCALSSTKNTYGFKMKIDQLTQRQKVRDVKAFLTRLHEEGWKIIYLSRRNLLRHALSDVLRVRSGKAHRYRSRDGAQPKVEKIPVDCESLLRGMEVRKARLAQEEQALSDLPCLRLIYDDDLYTNEQQERTLNRIVSWLGLEHEPLRSELVRNTPERLSDLVANYDELADSLAGTEYVQFLDEPIHESP